MNEIAPLSTGAPSYVTLPVTVVPAGPPHPASPIPRQSAREKKPRELRRIVRPVLLTLMLRRNPRVRQPDRKRSGLRQLRRFGSGSRSSRTPDAEVERFADESNRAVEQGHLHAAGVTTASRGGR